MVDALLNLRHHHFGRKGCLGGCIPPSQDIPVKISERYAQITSSNIDSGDKSVFCARVRRSGWLFGKRGPSNKFRASLPLQGTSGIFIKRGFHFALVRVGFEGSSCVRRSMAISSFPKMARHAGASGRK
jgi:hypothetical protein